MKCLYLITYLTFATVDITIDNIEMVQQPGSASEFAVVQYHTADTSVHTCAIHCRDIGRSLDTDAVQIIQTALQDLARQSVDIDEMQCKMQEVSIFPTGCSISNKFTAICYDASFTEYYYPQGLDASLQSAWRAMSDACFYKAPLLKKNCSTLLNNFVTTCVPVDHLVSLLPSDYTPEDEREDKDICRFYALRELLGLQDGNFTRLRALSGQVICSIDRNSDFSQLNIQQIHDVLLENTSKILQPTQPATYPFMFVPADD